MNQKRIRLYIIVGVCLVAAVLVILWTLGTFSSQDAISPTAAIKTVPSVRIGSDGTYTAPEVFPATTQFDTSVLNQSSFKALNSYNPVTLDQTQLGKDDLFKGY